MGADQDGELTPHRGHYVVVGSIVRPSIQLDDIWAVQSHAV
jgi:hypothetical protein